MTIPLKSRDQLSEAGGGTAQGPSRLPYIQAIDGLRALAVVAVVLNHIDFPGMSSGFVGVDIFFAISGFLITRQIVTKQAAGSPQQLREFWAGRARRIVPAMVLVIAVTCLGSVMFLAPQELERVGFYGFASDLFGMNIAAAARGGNYFDGPLRQSPFLHLWSLGVEEQFYLVWPLILGSREETPLVEAANPGGRTDGSWVGVASGERGPNDVVSAVGLLWTAHTLV